jgi:hypothetical protein
MNDALYRDLYEALKANPEMTATEALIRRFSDASVSALNQIGSSLESLCKQDDGSVPTNREEDE